MGLEEVKAAVTAAGENYQTGNAATQNVQQLTEQALKVISPLLKTLKELPDMEEMSMKIWGGNNAAFDAYEEGSRNLEAAQGAGVSSSALGNLAVMSKAHVRSFEATQHHASPILDQLHPQVMAAGRLIGILTTALNEVEGGLVDYENFLTASADKGAAVSKGIEDYQQTLRA